MNDHRHRWAGGRLQRLHDRPPDTTVRQVIEVRFRRGEGCCEHDPKREVVAFFDLDGTLLAERDPHHEAVADELAELADAEEAQP